MKKILLVCAAMLVSGFCLEAQQMTAVAICNWTRVMETSYKESQAMRELDDFRTQFQKDLLALTNEISELENQKLDADKAGNKDQSLQLEKTIASKKTYLEDFRRIRNDTYKARSAKVLTGPVVTEILDAINHVAEKEGFALVIRSDGPTAGIIVYNIPEIDITDKVIARMLEMGKR
jgi:outer membrane protein